MLTQEQRDAVWEVSTMLSSVCQRMEEMDVESELLDYVFKTLQLMENQCDLLLAKDRELNAD